MFEDCLWSFDTVTADDEIQTENLRASMGLQVREIHYSMVTLEQTSGAAVQDAVGQGSDDLFCLSFRLRFPLMNAQCVVWLCKTLV